MNVSPRPPLRYKGAFCANSRRIRSARLRGIPEVLKCAVSWNGLSSRPKIVKKPLADAAYHICAPLAFERKPHDKVFEFPRLSRL